MDVSIVTPVMDDSRLGAALDSILSQEVDSPIEVIVVDGGSTDETVQIIENYRDDIDVLVREPDEGLYDAMNKGIERASGHVVGILNADDRYDHRGVLEQVIGTLESERVDSCYGDLVYVGDDDHVIRYWKGGYYRPRKLYLGWMPPHPTFFAKRSLYERYGGFDLRYPIAADYELMLRLLLKHGVSTTYIDDVLVRMATGGQSNASLSNIVQANREVAQAWWDNDLTGGILAPFFKPLRKVPQFLRASLRNG